MSVNSNALNFMSFVQNSVDPRTGQYTMAIELPQLIGNNLSGPHLPLRLSFSPMNDKDAGFGTGWSLNLTQFAINTGMLSLATGESFKVADNGPGQTPVIAERKLESFHLHNEGDPDKKLVRYRVVHKSGLVEVLEPHPGNPDVALPVRMLAPSGHGLTLTYDRIRQKTCLVSVSDDTHRQLLSINHDSNNVVLITVHPQQPEKAGYILKRSGNQLREVVLPTDDQASWSFQYATFERALCVSEVKNPLGGVERIVYDANPHLLPPDSNNIVGSLPRVARHIVEPLVGQPQMVTRYTYTSKNFLGYGGKGVTWSEDGLDNLYKLTDYTYTYGSTAEYVRPGQAGESAEVLVRSVVRSFNRFHLLTKQVTLQDGCEETVKTVYHEIEGDTFEQQPSTLQLPKAITKQWRLTSDPRKFREEQVSMHYDSFGNLLRESLANGTRRVYTYYPAKPQAGSDCPEDPEGFVRQLESLTVYPAVVPLKPDEEPAQPVRLRYGYRYLPALTREGEKPQPGWLERSVERMLKVQEKPAGGELEIPLQLTEREHYITPQNALLHGRMNYQTTEYGPGKSRDVWHYKLEQDDAGTPNRLSTTQTHTVQGGTLQRRVEQVHNIHTAGLLQEQDLNGVISRYRYDVLNRLVEETVAPDDPSSKASRRYDYKMLHGDQRGAALEDVIDAQGVRARTYLDGASRPLRQLRISSDGQELPVHYEARYDSLGNLSGETYLDQNLENAAEHSLKLDYSYTYDGWGQRCTVLRPDDTREHRLFSPFGANGNQVTTWVSPPNAPDQRLEEQFSEYNLFDKPVHEYRLDGQREVGRQDYRYDGLGQCIEQTLTMAESALARMPHHHRPQRQPRATPTAVKRTTRMRYDVMGRMYETRRPDGSVLLRQFAESSINQLTTLFQVSNAQGRATKTVCKREFDEMERLARLDIGPRVQTYRYQPDTELLLQHTTYRMEGSGPGPDRRTITYTYDPNRTVQAKSIKSQRMHKGGTSADSMAKFDYDPKTANITSATNTEGSRKYLYTDQGQLEEEHWQDANGSNYTCNYRYSTQGLLLQRETSDARPIEHSYDKHGRLAKTRQGPLQANLAYNSAGLLHTTDTVDDANGRHLRCELFYDALGREVKRTLSVDAGIPHELHLVWRDDDMLLQRQLVRNGKELLTEYFEYDTLNRLAFHDSFGPNLPCNAKGRAIISQQFDFDELDNLTRCRTWFDGDKEDDANFQYKDDGSFQLASVKHTLITDYPALQRFSYDELGNALNDEMGRRLVYDEAGRLLEVRAAEDDNKVVASYRYDGHDQLCAVRSDSGSEVQRRYQGLQVDSTLQDGLLTQYLYNGDTALGLNQWRDGALVSSRLLLNDGQGSVIGEYDGTGLRPNQDKELRPASYCAYGERPDNNGLETLLAFNGELREKAFGWYLLGRGYRAFNPSLMRFHSPDSMDQEISGINPYLYCLGNPINWRDPTGHRSSYGYGKENPTDRSPHAQYVDPIEQPEAPKRNWTSWIGVVVGLLILVVSVVTTPWTGGSSLGVGIGVAGALLQASGVGFGVIAVLEDDPEWGNMFTMLSFGAGAVGGMMSYAGAAMLTKAAAAIKAAANVAQASKRMFTSVRDTAAGIASLGQPAPVSSTAGSLASSSTPALIRRTVSGSELSRGSFGASAVRSANPGPSQAVLTQRMSDVAEAAVVNAVSFPPPPPPPPVSGSSGLAGFKYIRKNSWDTVRSVKGITLRDHGWVNIPK
ncbi:MAG: RHS repeat-associated core domain-containing protein [Pseudomonas farsensis]|uniref:RHS repeat domain-containing protein n=1 Tax=Pseudomonas farsensis TaxID=2745492 RepID=UPI003C7D47CD